MPPAWRFTAPSAAWRRRCATTDDPRLDRGDGRVRRSRADRLDGAQVQAPRPRRSNARRFAPGDRPRSRRGRRAARARETPPRRPAVTLLIAVGALLTISSLVLAAPHAASASNRVTIAWLLGAAFAAGALLLGAGSAHDSRRVFLLGFLVCSASSFARAGLWPRRPERRPASGLGRDVRAGVPVAVRARFSAGRSLHALRSGCAPRIGAGVDARHPLGRRQPGRAASLVPETSVRAILPNHPENLDLARAHPRHHPRRRGHLRARASRAAGRPAESRAPGGGAGRRNGTAAVWVARTAVPAIHRWLCTLMAPRFWIDAVVIGALLATPILISAAVVFDLPSDRQQRVAHAVRRLLRRGALWSGARHRRQLAAALTSLRGARGTREIGRIVSHAIAAGLGVPLVRVLAGGRDGFADCLGTSMSAPMDAAFVAMIRVSPAPLRLDPGSSISCVLPA